MSLFGLLFLFCVFNASSAKLADYITPCSAKDPNLDDCVLKQTNILYPLLVKGIKEFGILPLEPLDVPFTQLEEGRGGVVGISFNITNSKHYGWANAVYTSVKVNPKKLHFKMEATTPVYSVVGDYHVSGRILVLPISGSGFSNITLVQVAVKLEFDGVPEVRDGRTYMKINSFKCSFHNKKTIVRMDNLFNNKELSDTMNRFLNENNKEAFRELQPGLEDLFGDLYLSMLTRLFSKIPLNHLMKDLDLP